jgi:hypothetical protein
MAYLNTSELELSDEFTFHEALPEEPYDPLWDGSLRAVFNPIPHIIRRHLQYD